MVLGLLYMWQNIKVIIINKFHTVDCIGTMNDA